MKEKADKARQRYRQTEGERGRWLKEAKRGRKKMQTKGGREIDSPREPLTRREREVLDIKERPRKE